MQMLIDGVETAAEDHREIDVTNPATGDVIDTIPAGGPADAERAIGIALAGQPAWWASPSHERSRVLQDFARLVTHHRRELSDLLCRENGKPLAQAEREIDTTGRVFAGYAHHLMSAKGDALQLDTQPGLERDMLVTRREPMGVVVALTPFNFPTSVFAHKVAPALAAGNSVVVKPSEHTPLSTLRLVALLLEAGVPPACCQAITGFGGDLGAALTSDPRVAVVSLTGSIATGQRVAESAATNLTRVLLELGGNDPVIVFADADLEDAAKEIVNGRLPSNGQVCCANKRVLVEESARGQLVDLIAVELAGKTLGDPLNASTDVGPLISPQAASHVHEQVLRTIEQGGRVVGSHDAPSDGYVAPVLIDDVPFDSEVARDMEIFGPVLPVIGFRTASEAIGIANASRCGLNAAVLTKDMQRGMSTAASLQAGMVTLNGSCLYRPDGSAFGGYKMSGVGREGLHYGLDEYSQMKTFAMRNVLP